jgi:outer membrane receptor for ferrienterochelin and colicin
MGHRIVAGLRPNRLSYAVALAIASLAASQAALAQDSASPAPAADASKTEMTKVLVVATRRSQQSSIDRKKNAATAMDSIVAEDVGSLPDRNVGEAISRMSGVALDRGDYGEGVNVSVRGNGPDLTRVELDGQAVQSAGGTDMLGGGNGRGVEFRQLSADLIKSVDVVKGSTADMTEGSLGGGIAIKTRTGLDFKKPFASVRLGSSQGSLNKKWSPDFNAILSDKVLDGRLGLLLNASSSELANESHSFQVSQTAQQGYYRLADFDNSPQKTFTFQPQTVNAGHHDVRQHDVGPFSPRPLQPLLAVAGADHLEPFDLEVDPKELEDDRVVVDHQHPRHTKMVSAVRFRPSGRYDLGLAEPPS